MQNQIGALSPAGRPVDPVWLGLRDHLAEVLPRVYVLLQSLGDLDQQAVVADEAGLLEPLQRARFD